MFTIKCQDCAIVVINNKPCHEQGCPSHFTRYIDQRGKEWTCLRFYSYDVWGNHKEGYEVNDTRKTDTTIMLREDAGHSETVKALKKAGVFAPKLRHASFETEWQDASRCELTWSKTGEPLGALVAE